MKEITVSPLGWTITHPLNTEATRNIAIQATNRDSLVGFVEGVLEGARLHGAKSGEPSLTIKMPCGNEFVAFGVRDIPVNSMRCPCGDPTHWLVKYGRVEE